MRGDKVQETENISSPSAAQLRAKSLPWQTSADRESPLRSYCGNNCHSVKGGYLTVVGLGGRMLLGERSSFQRKTSFELTIYAACSTDIKWIPRNITSPGNFPLMQHSFLHFLLLRHWSGSFPAPQLPFFVIVCRSPPNGSREWTRPR